MRIKTVSFKQYDCWLRETPHLCYGKNLLEITRGHSTYLYATHRVTPWEECYYHEEAQAERGVTTQGGSARPVPQRTHFLLSLSVLDFLGTFS